VLYLAGDRRGAIGGKQNITGELHLTGVPAFTTPNGALFLDALAARDLSRNLSAHGYGMALYAAIAALWFIPDRRFGQ